MKIFVAIIQVPVQCIMVLARDFLSGQLNLINLKTKLCFDTGKRYVQELDWLLPKWGYSEHLYHSIFTDTATGGYSWELQETDRVYGNGDFQSPNKPGYNIKHHWGKNIIIKKKSR